MPEESKFEFQYIAIAGLFFIILNLFYPVPRLEFLNKFFTSNQALTALIICFLLAMCFTEPIIQLASFGIGVTFFTFYEDGWLPQPLLIVIAFIIALVVYKVVRS